MLSSMVLGQSTDRCLPSFFSPGISRRPNRCVSLCTLRPTVRHAYKQKAVGASDSVEEALPFESKGSNENWNLLSFVSSKLPLLGLGALVGKANSVSNDGNPLSVIKAIGILAVVVAVHECGHFLAARCQNIPVDKFSIGFGPPIARYQAEDVEYIIGAIPLGGYVAFPDDDPDSKYSKDDPMLFRNRPIKDRALVISAGVLANFLFAFVLLFVQASTVGVQTEILKPGVVIPRVYKARAADQAGLKVGDVILSVDDLKVAPDPLASMQQVVEAIESHPDQEMTLTVDRKGKEYSILAIPTTAPDGHGSLGIGLAPNLVMTTRIAKNGIESVGLATDTFLQLNKDLLVGLRELVFNFSKTAERVSGPIAVVAMGSKVVDLDAATLFFFAAAVNINLAVVNTLPLPALDGGYFALLILEVLRGGKKLPEKVEKGVMTSGIIFLTALGCFLIVRDVEHLL